MGFKIHDELLPTLCTGCSPRIFDVEKGEHPVQFLIDHLVYDLYDPIQTWLEELLPGFPKPKDYAAPSYDSWK